MSEWRTDEAFAIVPMWLIESKVSNRALRLFALLSAMRDYGTDMAEVKRGELAARIGWSSDTLDRAKAELEKLGAITVERPRGGKNVYTVHRVSPPNRVAAELRPPRKTAAPLPLIDEKNSTPSELRVRIEQTWLSSEGMISHRESYFADQKVRRAIDKAVKKYGVDDVCGAIASYATVLASPDHLWSHRWTLLDFLNRGLDRFVPEAKPEEVFRLNGRKGGDNADDGLDYLDT